MRELPDIELKIEEVPVDSLVPYANNAKKHPDYQIDQIAASIEEFNNCDPIACWTNSEGKPEVVAGHGRLLALKKLGIETAPVIFLDHLTDEQRRAYTHVHNQTTLNSGFDVELLEKDIQQLDFDWDGFGFDVRPIQENPAAESEDQRRKTLAERFGVPPFTVLDARKGEWQERKRKWLALGIKSELGRGGGLRSKRDCSEQEGGTGRKPSAPEQTGGSSRRLTYNIDARATAYRG